MKKKTKLPKKCDHCNTKLVCCEEIKPYTEDSQIIEARKCPECERVYYMAQASNITFLPK